MNKKVIIRKDNKRLLVISILMLVLTFIFKFIYSYLGFNISICNIFFIINIILLLITIIFNLVLIFKREKLKKLLKFLKFYFIGYIILNTLVIIVFNVPYIINVRKVEEKIVSNCGIYNCETFDANKNIFSLTKQYLDYSGNSNYINIKNYYNDIGIYKIEAEIYSENTLYSEYLIIEQVKEWFGMYYGSEPDFYYLGEAFRKGTQEEVSKNKYTYKVEEVYENNKLIKIKSIINLNINKENVKNLK